MSKAEESIKAMREYFFSLPHDPNFRENEMGVWEYMELIGLQVSEISLGQRCSALMKDLKYPIHSKIRNHNPDSDWPDSEYKVYPRKILDTAFWFITKGKFEMEAKKVFVKKAKPAPSAIIAKTCGSCGNEFKTPYSFAKVCPSCYFTAKEAKM